MIKMELEECTKEELIWLIKHRCFHTAKDFEFDILTHRSKINQKAASAAFERANSALGEYCRLLIPYDGKPLISIPDTVIHKATEQMKIREAALRQYERLEKQYLKIEARTDKILEQENKSK